MSYKKKNRANIAVILGSGQAKLLSDKKFLSKTKTLLITKRRHLYEGYSMNEVVQPVRIARARDAKVLILTNAAGAVSNRVSPGDIMMIKDHLNLLFETPLHGADFLSLHDCYDKHLRTIAKKFSGRIKEGVYAAVRGPAYETPAEVKMLRVLGADAVGMSTVPEAIAARKLGMKVVAFSLITNKAGARSSHDQVLVSAKRTGNRLARLLEEVIWQISKNL